MFLYSAVSSPLDHSKCYTSPPDRPVHFDNNLTSLWIFQSWCNYCAKTISHISTTVSSQVLIYTAELTGASWREKKCWSFKKAAKGIRTRVLLIASPAFCRWATALHNNTRYVTYAGVIITILTLCRNVNIACSVTITRDIQLVIFGFSTPSQILADYKSACAYFWMYKLNTDAR